MENTLSRTSVIRFEIDGKWNAEEMGKFFLILDDLYMLQIAVQVWIVRSGARGRFFQKAGLKAISAFLREANPHSDWFQIVRIQYGSPGFQDLAGIGEIVGHIKDFVLRIIEHHSSRRSRQLTNRQMEIENARSFLQLAREYNIKPVDLRALMTEVNSLQRDIVGLVKEEKIRDVYLLDE